MIEPYEPFVSVGTALAAGLLIGLEREQSQRPGEGAFIGGVRTYPLFALLGVLTMLLGKVFGIWLPLLGFGAVAGFVAISYADDVRRERDRGLTTEVSILLTFLLGVLVASSGVVEPASRRVIAVAGLAVIITFLLSSKSYFQSVLEKVHADDLYATVKFLIVAILVLPLLPDETMGPLDVINPYNVGLMVVLIAGISLVGYVASRAYGAGRGLAITALLGGLVSSTAVTLSFAGRARKEPLLVPLSAAAIVLASTIMAARVLVEVAVVHTPLLRPLAAPIAAMAVTGVVAGALLFYRSRSDSAAAEAVPLTNPFELTTAVRFGLLYAGVLLASKAAQLYAGSAGMYAAAALAGTTDVDAITLSTASLARDGGLDLRVATTTILIGVVANTLVKGGLASVLGGWPLGRLVGLAYGAMILAVGLSLTGLWLMSG